MNFSKITKYIDIWLVGALILLSVFGIMCVGSAIRINLGLDPTDFYMQIAYFLTGLVIMVIVMLLDLELIGRLYKPIYILNLLLLILVLVVGTSVNNATRWIKLGPISIQPSEFAKIAMIVFLAKFISKNKYKVNDIKFIALSFIITIIPVILIKKQPSLSASLVIASIFVAELFVGGLDYKFIKKVLIIVIPIAIFLIFDILREDPLIVDKIFDQYQITRILSFINPESNPDTYYQTMQSMNAIGSGQFFGKGLYGGTLNQLSYLPEPHNDFIFSVIGEEFGFLGCVFVLLLLFTIIFRCILIAADTNILYYKLIVCGVATMLAFQTFVNVGVATGILPNTGMPLPFVSAGGSAMWANMMAIGLVLNINRKRSQSVLEVDI